MNQTIEQLEQENQQLRQIICDCAAEVGGYVNPQATLEFMQCVPTEIELTVNWYKGQISWIK